MLNIIKRIFLCEEHIDDVILHETTEIIAELQENDVEKDDSMMYLKEELKQVIFRRTGKIHAHINSVDIEIGEIRAAER